MPYKFILAFVMKINFLSITSLVSAFLFINEFAFSQPFDTTDVKQTKVDEGGLLPFWADWAKDQGIELPLPFGVSAFYIFMSRDIEVKDVSIEFLDREPQSISDFSTFAVRNKTSVAALKFDAWLLPLLNVYASFGYATTNALLNANFTIDRPISPVPPIETDVESQTRVEGPYWGFGSTLVAGYANWFVMGDANYGKTFPDKLNNSVTFTFLSMRTGLTSSVGKNVSLKTWVGGAYMYSKTTLEISVPSETLDEILIKIKQEPVNPWTAHLGFILSTSKRFDFMIEIGTNFNDASVSIFSATYRF
ncbi:MAG TPA: hypothetical protein VLM39_03150 [Ignavibacteriaceae bacterium]|nr:hypothetical protein [Ignavibacteriaceae bacterium]